MVIKLSIYAIHGTSTQYNNLGSTVNNGVSQVYSSTVRKGINVGKMFIKIVISSKLKKNLNDKILDIKQKILEVLNLKEIKNND
ncbi:hypothetical protein M1771_05310 [Spiroplasma citri]|uniref:Plectrovirus-related protein n=1 Tax=Spiroplasma citri TaxID=2133 RepID=A0AAX3SW33_SPICI|nr:hypothetical protein [Spiroplasma citri]WFG95521.1 hypothetical protein M0C40_05340 [Spiroplasma citri]WFG99410.1 hypothetical protein M1771_05310 [Spiroplasma citri]